MSELDRLVGALRAARDPWSRLRLIASGAGALARMTPGQRSDMMKRLGLQGAEELAEAAAGGDPRTVAALQRALADLEQNPMQWKLLGQELADPKRRRQALGGLSAHLLEVVTRPDQSAVAPAEPAAGPTPALSTQQPPDSPVVPPPPPAPTPATAVVADVAVVAAATTRAASTESADEAPAERSPIPDALPAPQPAAAAPAERARDVVAASAGEGEKPPQPTERPAAAAVAAPLAAERGTADEEHAWSRFDAAASGRPTVSATLSALRSFRHQLAAGSAEVDAGDLLAALPADWARRRALASLFASGRPAALDDALSLVGRLTAGAQRRWALGDLATSRAWSDAEWSQLLATADSPAHRRRLATMRRGPVLAAAR